MSIRTYFFYTTTFFLLLLAITLISPNRALAETAEAYALANADTLAKPDDAVQMPAITVEAGRVTEKSAVTFTNLDAEEIAKRNTATDLPLVLNNVPGVFSYSEAGNPLGYSYLRIRGFDQSKVAVMINGMPLNDPESHLVYWVDLPDIAAGAEDIQVQRGSGGSHLGLSPFGGAVNLVTLRNAQPGIRGEFGFGSWQTRKTGMQYSSGLLSNQWSFTGRFSNLSSEGYRDDSWSQLWSAQLSAARIRKNGSDRLNILLGQERLGLAYNGVPMDSIRTNPKYNPLSAPVDQVDQFSQPHFQWLSQENLASNLKYSHTLYLSQGKGSYIQWKPDRDLEEYGIGPVTVKSSTGADSLVTHGDIVREKWVAMLQTGWLPRMEYNAAWGDLNLEAELRRNVASHWGVVNWSSITAPGVPPQPEYSRWRGVKEYYGVAANAQWHATPKLLVSPGLSVRHISYDIDQRLGLNTQLYPGYNTSANWTFFLPRLGFVYDFGTIGLGRMSIARSAREPGQSQLFEAGDGSMPQFKTQNGNSWEDPIAKPEELTSLEIGFRHEKKEAYRLDASLYYNIFQNEIIPVGGLNDLGEPRLGNAKSSYQLGFELDGAVKLPMRFALKGNFSFAQAKFSDYTVYDQILDANWSPVGTNATKLDGNDVPNVPSLLTSGTLEYRQSDFELWTTTRYVGKIALNNRGISEYSQPPYAVTGAGWRYTFPNVLAVGLQIDARVENLFNRKYAAAGYFYEYASPDGIVTVNEFYPGAPRNYWFGISVKL